MSVPFAPKCNLCQRERTVNDDAYNPIQVFTGRPLGWYSGDDGELCGDCMTKLVSRPGEGGRVANLPNQV